jgi:hypothetical protein
VVFSPNMAGMKTTHYHFDVYSATVPILYLLKILGFAPFVLEGKVRTRRLTFSVSSAIYSVTTSIIITYFRYVTYGTSFEARFGLQMISTVLCFGDICDFFINCFLTFLGVMNSCKVAAILNMLSEFDNILGGMACICFRSVRYNSIQLYLSFCCYIYFNILFFMSDRKFYIIPKITINVDNVIITCFNSTQINLILLLKQRFEFLNFQLLELVQNSHKTTIEFVPHKRYKGVNVSSRVLPLGVTSTSEYIKSKLATIRYPHDHLCDTSDHYNSLYSGQNLLGIAISFIAPTLNPYIILLSNLTFDSGVSASVRFQLITLLETCYHAVNVGAVAWSGSSAAQQVSSCICKLSPWSRILLYKLIVVQLVTKFPLLRCPKVLLCSDFLTISHFRIYQHNLQC